MGDFVKWGLLVAGALVLIGLILALPFMEFLNVGELTTQINVVVTTCGSFLTSARGLINIFLPPFGRVVLSGLIGYFLTKWIVMIGIKTTTWIYHFIFK